MASNTNKDYTQMHIKASDIQKRMHHIFLF